MKLDAHISDLAAVVKDNPIQIADDGFFDRNRRGQSRGGRAHPFSGDDAFRAITHTEPPAIPAPVVPFKQHAQEQQLKLKKLGDKQQNIVSAAADPNVIPGNAVDVGMKDNATRNQGLVKNWNLIDPHDTSGTLGRAGGIVLGTAAIGLYSQKKIRENLELEKNIAEPLFYDSRADVKTIKATIDRNLAHARINPSQGADVSGLEEKSDFLREFLRNKADKKLESLVDFKKVNPSAFSATETTHLKALAEQESKLDSLAKGLTRAGGDVSGFRRFYQSTQRGLWEGMKFVGASTALNEALKFGAHYLPIDHNETDRIFDQSTTESALQGAIGASPIRSLSTRLALSAGVWLASREEKMTPNEAAATTAVAAAVTVAVGLKFPSLRKAANEAIKVETVAFGVGRLVHDLPFVGVEIPELQNTSTNAWNQMKNDGENMTGNSLHRAVQAFDKLGDNWRNVIATYQRDIMGGISHRQLPMDHGNAPLTNYHNILVNSRTGLVLSESMGDTFLKAGLTEASKNDLLNRFQQQSADDAPALDRAVIAPNQGDLDLTSRAARNYMQALTFSDVTVANMKAGQENQSDSSANKISGDDIDAVKAEKMKVEKTLAEQIFRSAPGAQPHNIKDIVESTDGLIVNHDKFKLTDYAANQTTDFSKMVTAMENKAYLARDNWLPQQAGGPNAELSTEYVAKLFRDAAVMRLAYMNNMLTTQRGHSTAPDGQDVTKMQIYMEGSKIGSLVDGANANRNVKSTVEAAFALEPNNPDMKAIVSEYNDIANRITAFQANLK